MIGAPVHRVIPSINQQKTLPAVALLDLAITTVEAAGHITARNALHVAPVGGVDLIEHKAEAANQRIPRADAAGCVPRMGVMCSSLFTLKAQR